MLGAARIARLKVIPAMQAGELTEVAAIASRDLNRAVEVAQAAGIPKAYGSYEALISDPDIDAIYNPLPNHLHAPWTIAAMRAGKHVLCEKPIALSVNETLTMIRERDAAGVKAGEAFMVQSHPQWLRALELLRSGEIGKLRAVSTCFSFFNDDPSNVRNVADWGGGALMDVGCYAVKTSRMLFDSDPVRVIGLFDRDPSFHVDRVTSALLDYGQGHCVFNCGTQIVPYQRVQVLGTSGRIELEIPFNAPNDRPVRIWCNGREETFAVCDQYTLQGDSFSRAVLEGGEVPVPLEDSLKNMAVIEALFRSGESGRWESPCAAMAEAGA